MKNYTQLISKIVELGGTISAPVNEAVITNSELKVGEIPTVLKEFYKISNGIEAESFRILPLYDSLAPKKTWDSIERANNPQTSKFSLDRNLLSKFFIFCELQANHCVFMDKEDNSIWYEDDKGYHKTDFLFDELLKALIKEESQN